MTSLIALATDFGAQAIYTGQMRAVISAKVPQVPVVDLINDLPRFQPQLSAYLLASLAPYLPKGAVFVCVVDPGVGSQRRALMLEANGHYFVGPDNGILAIVGRRAVMKRWWCITWQPENLSSSFHGRDLFAPIASMLAMGEPVEREALAADQVVGSNWPDDLCKIVYVDHFGNLIVGVRANQENKDKSINVSDRSISFAMTFSDVLTGHAFWYANSNGLVEIAVNQGRADRMLGLGLGDPVAFAGL